MIVRKILEEKRGEVYMDIEMMSGGEMKEEIIRMLEEIDDDKILEQIYHFVKKLLRMEKNDD